ncbi:hypothetical protein CAPTEDRAFT_162722 [Capitella teleta]|uniref:Uncharacterized protein n=1 Tax=Capitella teleta TaxID=283909 RepID=R7UA77_CAPTE|nr:hypothetical protein CAPTEDRAFT_162722 [Capitella teleta]|eukprot:ELU03270.1 hypothetical protein CAPTEDRAFT_162722 [Capitella teleta]
MSTRLPRDMQGLMGEANMRFARGDHDEAMSMCMEVIRVVPNAWEPFQTMSMIYEEKGDHEKCLQYSLIGAHLNGRNLQEWIKVAEMCVDMDRLLQASMCYTQAIRCDPKDINLWFLRCDLYEKIGDKKRMIEGYQHILDMLPEEKGERFLQITRDLATNFHSSGDYAKASAAMLRAFEQYPAAASIEDLNLLMELYLLQKEYSSGIMVDASFRTRISERSRKVSLKSLINTEFLIPYLRCKIPENFHVDLRTKLIVCCVHLHLMLFCLQNLTVKIMTENPEDIGDLYLDIAEAFMEAGSYKEAQPILAKLVKSKNYCDLAAVWLRYGECLNSIGDLNGAVHAYKRVVVLAPGHLSARVSLSALQQQLGRPEEALAALNQAPQSRSDDDTEGQLTEPRLLLHRCSLLYSQQHWEEFVECARNVLYSHIKSFMSKELLKTILSYKSLKHRMEAIRYIHGSELEKHINAGSLYLKAGSIDADSLWDLYIRLAKVLVKTKQYEEFENVAITALVCPQFMNDPEKSTEADFLCLTACLMNRNGNYAYALIRDVCLKNITSNRAWNLFGQVTNMSQDMRHNRFCLRLAFKHQDNQALNLLNGHTALVSGTYKHALGEYVVALKQSPRSPLIHLCLGLTFFLMACQKFSAKRHTMVNQGCAFLNQYMELRGECQESYYNLGRAMHQLSLLHAATYYYNKALEFPCPVQGKSCELFDLTKEIAYNLTLIYRLSGSHDLAAYIMQKYLVI